jgi:ATP-binding cassette subfamily F protein 3
MRVEGLAKSYERCLFKELSFQIERGERWAILGSNGSGKSTLLKCLLGEVEQDAGKVSLGQNLKIGYFDQLLGRLPLEASAAEAIRVSHRDLDDLQRRSILGAFGISGDLATKPLRMLSGGEKNRTMLAWLSAMEANVLILDEPTNHLDLWSRHALEQAIDEYDGTVILVTHDRFLVNAVADHVLVIRDGKVSQIKGNYDAYRHWLKEGLAVADRGQVAKRNVAGERNSNGRGENSIQSNESPNGKPARRKRKFPYRKIGDLEQDITQLETHIEDLHRQMLEPENLRDGRKMKQLQAELADSEAQLLKVYEHYEEACELN